MKLRAVLLCGILAAGSSSALEQDFYISGSSGAHSFADEVGHKFGLHIGAKNVGHNNFFLGGELEFSILDNDNFEKKYQVKEDYSYAANIPFGKRFQINERNSVDAYGLVGYSALRVYNDTADAKGEGFRWGAGVDGNFSKVTVGLRYTQGKLKFDSSNYEDTEKNLSLLVGYRIKL